MRSSDESAQRAPQRTATAAVADLRLSLVRDHAVLSLRHDAPHDQRRADEILSTAAAVGEQPGAFVLSGGDPIRRDDLVPLLAELARLRPAQLALCVPGDGVSTTMARTLRAAGVQRVLVPFHCARQDAHDWLVGRAGALKTAHRAIRACLDADLPVAAEVTLTRPTMPHLAETVELLARLGVRSVCVRRLSAAALDGPAFVPVSPRLSLLRTSLEDAAAVALQRRVRLRLRDLPVCVAPRLRPLFAPPDSERWVMPDGALTACATAPGCATCPGAPYCAGAPPDYTARFGWEELVDLSAAAVRVHETVEDQRAPQTSAPMVFAWRGPRRVRCEACADEATGTAKAPPYESTRVIRARLVEAARYRPSVLRLVGADLLAHPQAALLIYDAVRLFPHVEIAGEASPMVDWSDLDLRRMKEVRRIDVALYGPDAATHDAHCGIPGAFAAMLRGIEHVRRRTEIKVGAYAVLHDARAVAGFAEAWGRGALPGEPRFRLSPRGGSLDELAEGARDLSPGPARTALLAMLPQCVREHHGLTVEPAEAPEARVQQTIHCGRSIPHQPCGSDPIGVFEPCRDGAESCASLGCPGTAVGWQSSARSKRWTANI
jgi:MoaA/NifB/PqqE/SkfB family radical SAM enzyme